ncbi:hypothetical protein [Spirosoma sp. 48-14]|uniref:hypothetical protein n=1 Tax=Spirosoma sp. 48-14 TaxID=1895854 RepID=UPI000961E5AC|nr:hypothetical protein [Spirosoma sp. 48-14]OJW75701.1 MAG: hypothetical protein BGO59_09040 [Spirosoma sp. 48-14]
MSEINHDLLPVRLSPTQKKFEAGGHTYYVEHEARLSVARDRWLEKFNLYGLLGRDAATVLREIRSAYDSLNSGRVVDAGVTLNNILLGLGDLNAKAAPLYYICTLFINRQDEDRKAYDLEFARQKIEDWQGIERDFFLSLALSYLTITGQQLNTLMETFSTVSLPELTLKTPPSDS